MIADFLSQNLIWVAAFVVVTNLWIWSFLQGSVKGVGSVSAMGMPALQRGGKSVTIDVSDTANFDSGHIPDATNIPLAELSADNKALMKHEKKTVILVCETGSKSSKAARALVSLGFENLHILSGGMISWNKENLPTESTTSSN